MTQYTIQLTDYQTQQAQEYLDRAQLFRDDGNPEAADLYERYAWDILNSAEA